MALQRTHQTTRSPIEEISQTSIPEHISELLGEYEDVVGERDPFLWQWLYSLFPEIRLSCVDTRGDRVRDAKLLASMYVVLLDDLAEVAGDEETFREAAKAPHSHQVPDPSRPGVDGRVVELASRAWECVETAIESGPRSDEFRDLLLFDLEQNVNAIEYSYLLNETLDLASVEECTRYDSYNMMLFTYVDLDLMYSTAFDRGELGPLRELVRRAQQMARIGNWVTTWERELDEGDFSSGVVVAALENDIVTKEQLARLRYGADPQDHRAITARIRDAGIEEQFYQQWLARYREALEYRSELESADVETFLDGMVTVLEYHLASRGMK